MTTGDDDRRLFEEAVRDARPLRHEPRVVSRRRPAPRAAFRRADELAVLDDSLAFDPLDLGVESGEELVFRHAQVAEIRQRSHVQRAPQQVGRQDQQHQQCDGRK